MKTISIAVTERELLDLIQSVNVRASKMVDNNHLKGAKRLDALSQSLQVTMNVFANTGGE
jgi:hypothetical protein